MRLSLSSRPRRIAVALFAFALLQAGMASRGSADSASAQAAEVGSAAAAAESPVTPDDVQGPRAWGAAHNVTTLRHLHFSGQPDQAGLEAAQAAGVGVVLNLRHPSEMSFDEAAAVEALGMSYVNIPVVGEDPFSPEVFARIEETVKRHEDEQVWIHCASGNRVGGWLATHLTGRHGMAVDDALAVARRAGITKPGIEDKVRAFVAAQPAAGGSGAATSRSPEPD